MNELVIDGSDINDKPNNSNLFHMWACIKVVYPINLVVTFGNQPNSGLPEDEWLIESVNELQR